MVTNLKWFLSIQAFRNEAGKAKEDQIQTFSDSHGAVLVNLLTSLRHLPSTMHSVLIIMALSWVILKKSLFVKLLMIFLCLHLGSMFYCSLIFSHNSYCRGDPKGDTNEAEAYDQAVREEAFDLLLNSERTQNCATFF